jgi:chitinase
MLISAGVKSAELNGFSQPASAYPPTGTWENGVFDYDHLKKSYLPTYTRYWDSQSKVPFLYNSTTGIWISYDDRESIRIKSDYIKREELAGAMFWELSGDRRYELIDVTKEVLSSSDAPSPDSYPPVESKSPAVPTSTAYSKVTAERISAKKINKTFPVWQMAKQYSVGDRVMYQNKPYRCIRGHMSLQGWTPMTVPQLWQSL